MSEEATERSTNKRRRVRKGNDGVCRKPGGEGRETAGRAKVGGEGGLRRNRGEKREGWGQRLEERVVKRL